MSAGNWIGIAIGLAVFMPIVLLSEKGQSHSWRSACRTALWIGVLSMMTAVAWLSFT